MSLPEQLTVLDAADILQAQAAGACTAAARARCHSDCCHALSGSHGRVVAVTLPDVIALAAYLHQPRDERELRSAVAQIMEHHCTLSPFTGCYMLTGAHGDNSPCPYQSADGSCSVYSVRPLLCRVFFHCEWIGHNLWLDRALDDRLTARILEMAEELGRYWPGQAGLLWRQPWRYDQVLL